MNVTIHEHSISVERGDSPRVKTESHFWFMLRNAMNSGNSISHHDSWQKIRNPGALSSMPYALRLGPNRRHNMMVIDPDYAIRNPATSYNRREIVTLALVDAEAT